MKLESLFPNDFIVSEKEKRRKLKAFYKYIKKCEKCKKSYGTDSEKKNKCCPVCYSKKRTNTWKKNMIKKRKSLLTEKSI